MKPKNTLCGLSIAVTLQLGMLAASAQTNIYLNTGSETNITLPPGTYNITAYGAQGGNSVGGGSGGLGAEMEGQFNFASVTTLTILVGGGGGSGSGGSNYGACGGGGGGSFVVNSSNTPLVIAGGGGGAFTSNGNPGLIGTNGTGGGAGGVYGYGGGGGGTGGGGGGGGYSGGGGGGGGGYSGNGIAGYGGAGIYGVGGYSFLNGGDGGTGYVGGGTGGYGGGGGGYVDGSGGGGGYSGGGGSGNYGYGGGGGGSIIDSSAVTNLAEVSGIASPDDSTGNGEIIITAVSAPPVPFTYTTNNGAITITGYTGTNSAVTIPGTINSLPVTSIGASAFYLDPITSVTVPQSVTNIGVEAFAGCRNLTNITVAAGNPDYTSVNGVLFNQNQTTLITFPGGIGGSYTIPNSVTAIADYGFYGGNLQDVIIPNSVGSIGTNAFVNSPLNNITIGTGVTNIGSGAFYYCSDLRNVIIPNSVVTIGADAFFESGLINVTIGTGVTSIGSGAFASCSGLQSVYFQGNAPTPTNDTSVFQNDASAIAYYLPGATGWGATFDGIPTSVILPPPPALSIALTGVPGLATNASGNFVLTSSPVAGPNPSTLVAFTNANGNVDLVCANVGSSPSLTLSTNNGSGLFSSNATYTVGGYQFSMTAADVNGDGKVDLITADYYNAALTVLTNNGIGGFAFNATVTLPAQFEYVRSVTAADIYGNGKVDLICATSYIPIGNNAVALYTNNGSGGFTLAGTGGAASGNGGDGGFYCLTAFTNVDGRVALAGANSSSGASTLTLFTNNGSGSGFPFVPAATLNVGNGPIYVTAADVNGDGKMDLICANYSDNTLTVLTNNGTGGFVTSGTYPVGATPYAVTAADVNGDGKVDLICANSGTNTLTVYTNNGSGGFVLSATLTVGLNPNMVMVADVNHDGLVDLVCTDEGGNTLTVLTNTPAVLTNTGNRVVISWPSSSNVFYLQQNSNPATTNWTPNTNAITTANGTNSVTIPLPVGNLFFRLEKPGGIIPIKPN